MTTAPAVPFHPLADIFPLMEGKEFDDLVEDIRCNGLLEPIVLYEDKILDGRNRYRACLAADADLHFVKWQRLDFPGISPHEFVISINLQRRHLTAEQKRDLIARVIKEMPERSNRQIAEVVKADDKTVGAVRRELEGRAEIPHVKTRTDTRGRVQPAAKLKRPSPNPRRSDVATKQTAAPAAQLADLKKSNIVLADQAAPAPDTSAHDVHEVLRELARSDAEIEVLRELAHFVLRCSGASRTSIFVPPADGQECKRLLERVEAIVGRAA